MNRELSSLLRLYKSHMRSRNKQKNPYSKKVETTYSSLVRNVGRKAPRARCWWAKHHVFSTQSPVRKSGGFLGSPSHMTKKDSWLSNVEDLKIQISLIQHKATRIGYPAEIDLSKVVIVCKISHCFIVKPFNNEA